MSFLLYCSEYYLFFYEEGTYIRSKEFCCDCVSGYTVMLAAPVEHFARKTFVPPAVNSLGPTLAIPIWT